jgi:hypothetical protein
VLDRISLIRNIGKFDSVSDGANLPLSKLTLIYAENGRGKTTLSAILRSLGSGDPAPIAERKRLSATQPPHVVVKPLTGAAMNFQGGTWTQTIANLAVFDDVSVMEIAFILFLYRFCASICLSDPSVPLLPVTRGMKLEHSLGPSPEASKSLRSRSAASQSRSLRHALPGSSWLRTR